MKSPSRVKKSAAKTSLAENGQSMETLINLKAEVREDKQRTL